MPTDLRVHLDTDFGSNPDDACAVAMTLGWPGAEVVGLTTTDDADGARARELTDFLGLVETAAPVTSGADTAATLDALGRAIGTGATLVALGACTNLARLQRSRPGALSGVRVVMMGGWVDPFAAGYPAWGPERDHNVQSDVASVLAVFSSGADLTFVPCAAAVSASLRTPHLAPLRATGPAGRVLADQCDRHGRDRGYPSLARQHPSLPDDLVTFHWDPATCAVALGWDGASVEDRTLRPVVDAGLLRFEDDPGGRRTSVVTAVDGDAFAAVWLTAVAAAQRRPST